MVPESSAALPPVSPEDKYLNHIICVISVSTGDVGSQHQRKRFRTRKQHFIWSGIFRNSSSDGVLKQFIMHGYTIHAVFPEACNLLEYFHVMPLHTSTVGKILLSAVYFIYLIATLASYFTN